VVVGSATVKPGKTGTIKVSIIMHEGMDGPHLFHIFIKSSDPEKRVTVLKVKADIVSLDIWRRSHPRAFYLPRKVAHLPLRSEIEGFEAMVFARRALGPHGQIQNAYLGRYAKDKQGVHLLVSEYRDSVKAQKLLSQMVTRMEKEAGASYQFRRINVRGNPVYALKNEAHQYFYFQSDNKVVWLFPDEAVARQSLEEVVQHMQMQGL
jgi:hypothetical protein